MFLNSMQCMVSQLVNVCMNVLCHFSLKLEHILLPVDRVLRAVMYIVVQMLGTEQYDFCLSMPKFTNCIS